MKNSLFLITSVIDTSSFAQMLESFEGLKSINGTSIFVKTIGDG
ncbi:MAG: hypothetical protein RIE86_10110 [Imperialibacter sp.]